MLRWCKKYCTCLVMNMTYATRSAAADELFDRFTEAVAAGAHNHALLFALQAVAEALEQMKCIFVNAQQRAAEHNSSGMLSYIATRCLAQSNELHVFLAHCNLLDSDACPSGHCVPSKATASISATL
jgi:hypothetical protein